MIAPALRIALLIITAFGSVASWGQTLSSNLRFIPVTPCRVLDTRGNGFTGPFGQPSLAAGNSRTIPFVSSGCSLPSTARAYALNATLVPISGGAFRL